MQISMQPRSQVLSPTRRSVGSLFLAGWRLCRKKNFPRVRTSDPKGRFRGGPRGPGPPFVQEYFSFVNL